jgi:hypothetical protein
VKVEGDFLLGILPIFEDAKDAAAAIEGLGGSIAPEQNRRVVTLQYVSLLSLASIRA